MSLLRLGINTVMSTNIDQILSDLGNVLKAGSGTSPSAGIRSTATNEQLIITNDGVETGVLRVERVAGKLKVEKTVQAEGFVAGGRSELADLNVTGKLTADTLTVKRLISDESQDAYVRPIAFNGNTARELDGFGFLWNEGDLTRQFVYKADPKRIFSTESIDLYKTETFKINGNTVISETGLGPAIVDSNLRTLGDLRTLTVVGNADLGETLYVNSYAGRIGILTDEPKAAVTAVENGTEVVLGADEDGIGFVGSWSGKAFSIVTDNTKRITQRGNVTEFGNEVSKNSVVKIFGTLEVDSVVSDSRTTRSSSLEFEADDQNSIFGKGLVWKGEGATRKFILATNPDRFLSTEDIELSINKKFRINGQEILSETTLGETVTQSNLETLGTLLSLTTSGNVNLNNSIVLDDNGISVNNSVAIRSGEQVLTLSSNGLNGETFKFANGDTTHFAIESDGPIKIGNQDNTARTINAYGRLSVNVTNPEPEAAFTVDGLVMMNGKRFSNGTAYPNTGNWSKGDIVWNSNPQATSFIGWVCVMSGTPGHWKPFGNIGA
jgi:hypothetical protein